MKGHYNTMTSKPSSSKRRDMPTGGNTRREAHPNGGEVARLDIPRAKMPQNSSSAPIHHTPLQTDLGKMPKQHSASKERDPFRR